MLQSVIFNDNSCFSKLASIGKFAAEWENKYAMCFAEVTGAIHNNENIRQICEALPYKITDFNMVDFANSMANLGYESKSIKMTLGEVDSRLYPCLFIPHGQDPKVVFSREGSGETAQFTLFDSADGKHVTTNEFNEVEGTVYFFRHLSLKDQKNESSLRKSVGHGWFRITVTRFRSIFLQVMGVGIVLNIASLATPLFIMMVYDHVMAAKTLDKLYMLTVGVSLAIAAEMMLRTLRARSLSWFSARIDYIVSITIFNKLLHLPAALIEHGSIAGQVARLKTFESVRDFFTGPLFLVLVEFPFTLIILAVIAMLAGWLAVIPVVVAGAYGLLILATKSRMKLAIHSTARSASAKQQSYIETFDKLHSLKANGMHEVWNDQFRDVSGRSSLSAFKSNLLASMVESMSHAFALLAGLSVVYFGVSGVISGDITAGALVATMILVWRVLSPLQMLCGALPRMEQLKQSIIQIDRLMDIEAENSSLQGLKSNNIRGFITLNKVGLRYNKEAEPVFAGLTFHVKPGELVTIAGSNGMGKSTVLKLINGLYRPQAGTVKIDGVDIRQMNPVALRKQIAYVSQSPEFFRGTIAENLRYAEPMATDDEIFEALRQVDAVDEIQALPKGIYTEIGAGLADQLSTSLTYRLNLARAYLKNSQIMLMDELPYELLTSKAGEIYKNTLLRWKGSKTMIVVTHRDDFINISDTVIVLRGNEGALVGKPEQVMEILKTGRS